MSVKIYNGWRWKKSFGFFEMLEEIKKAAQIEFAKDLKEAVVRMELDKPGTKEQRYNLAFFIGRLINRDAYSTDSAFDYNRVYYIQDAGDFYLMIPQNTRISHTALYSVNGLENFQYWNNVDPPEDVPFEEWEARGEFWEKYWKEKAVCSTFELIDPVFPTQAVMDVLVPDIFTKMEVDDSYWEAGRKKSD